LPQIHHRFDLRAPFKPLPAARHSCQTAQHFLKYAETRRIAEQESKPPKRLTTGVEQQEAVRVVKTLLHAPDPLARMPCQVQVGHIGGSKKGHGCAIC